MDSETPMTPEYPVKGRLSCGDAVFRDIPVGLHSGEYGWALQTLMKSSFADWQDIRHLVRGKILIDYVNLENSHTVEDAVGKLR